MTTKTRVVDKPILAEIQRRFINSSVVRAALSTIVHEVALEAAARKPTRRRGRG